MIQERMAIAGGHRIFYRFGGAGPAILLIHGFPTSSYLWRHILPHLATTYTVLAPDLLGYGRSDHPAGVDLSLPAQADLLAEFLQAVGVARAHVVGHEMGGGVAQYLALHHPERVASLVLMDSVCFSSWPTPEAALLQWPVSSDLLLTAHGGRGLRAWLERALFDPSLATEELVAAYAAPFAGPAGQEDLVRAARYLDAAQTQAIAPLLGRLRLPVTILWGSHDRIQPPVWGARLHLAIPGSSLRILFACGHLPPEDQPQAVVRELLTHLQAAAQGQVPPSTIPIPLPQPPAPGPGAAAPAAAQVTTGTAAPVPAGPALQAATQPPAPAPEPAAAGAAVPVATGTPAAGMPR